MLNSVFLKTVRDMRAQILGWGTGLGAMVLITVLAFPIFDDMPNMEGFVEALPPALQKLIGGQTVFFLLEDFLRLKLFESWLPILISVFAIVRGAASIAEEEVSGTIDLLMANPIERWRVVIEKYAAIAVAVVVMAVFACVGLIAGIAITGMEADPGRLILATFGAVPIALVFGAISLMGSCVFRRPRHASSIAVVLLVLSYFIYTLAQMTNRLQPWLKVSIFHYYTKSLPFSDGGQVDSLLLMLGLIGLFVIGAVAAFRRKDLAV